jgi:hypothetical protein
MTAQLEQMIEHPSSTLAFTLTFLSLATAIPSIFRFAPALRLATALEKLGAYQLLFCIFFTPSPSPTTKATTPTTMGGPDDVLQLDDSEQHHAASRRMLGVAKAIVSHKTFGEAKELLFE